MKGNNCLRKIIVWVFLFLASLCHAADEAIVLNVSGRAVCEFTIKQEDKTIVKKTKDVAIADILSEGDKITVKPDFILNLKYFSTGVQEEISGSGSITVGKNNSQKIDDSIRIKSHTVFSFEPGIKPITNEDMDSLTGVLRNFENDLKTDSSSQIRMLRLAQTRSRNRIPELKWKKVSGAEKYRVTVPYDTDQVYPETETLVPCFKAEKISVRPGKFYRWKVGVAAILCRIV